jgi:transcriptional/translational regulatory protein YebC/TACO1
MTPATELHAVRTALEEGGFTVDSSDLTMVPQNTIAIETAEAAKKVLRLVDAIDDHDDVQDVYGNFDIPDDILATMSVEA